jgi:hypothetical protein
MLLVPAGLGGTAAVPVSSSDTRNVMEAADDPYREESVLVSSCTAAAGTTVVYCQPQRQGRLVGGLQPFALTASSALWFEEQQSMVAELLCTTVRQLCRCLFQSCMLLHLHIPTHACALLQ